MLDRITSQSLITKQNQIISGMIDDDLMMMSIENGHYYTVNSTGQRIWEMLDIPRTLGELCELISAEFEVDPATCQEQVKGFINQLAKRQLVSIRREE